MASRRLSAPPALALSAAFLVALAVSPVLARDGIAPAGTSVPTGAIAQAQAGAASSSAQRALLLRGPDRRKGLPFFAPNAIAALSGTYGPSAGAPPRGSPAAAAGTATVWFTREAVVLGSDWKRVEIGGYSGSPGEAAYSLERPRAGLAVALTTSLYTLFFELPGLDAGSRAFVLAFERKFLPFYQNAATDAELSFPAYVDY